MQVNRDCSCSTKHALEHMSETDESQGNEGPEAFATWFGLQALWEATRCKQSDRCWLLCQAAAHPEALSQSCKLHLSKLRLSKLHLSKANLPWPGQDVCNTLYVDCLGGCLHAQGQHGTALFREDACSEYVF